ncbi:hypothetical protein HYH02_015295 [Chlamydomonas schloesseri]|uniref:Uncharacterized protein n=1 Tax=Chlamydomonas schloesseri TaxID=2026947 RepID=A0A835SNJ2_9CHLO|nr:hypothetical protein HYH02_015295 [Chlamydomonas schloesseri]|eukprot:KAG2423680.1 hypothetical protein HYH02_015295 [Chlamydomonas schloesseri]
MVVQAMYNFTDSKEERVPGQRRNRGFQKKQERNLMSTVVGLANMSPKQLAAVAHLLPPGTVEAIGIAARLPRANQGRKRQEQLVAKMMRGQVGEGARAKLEAAVALAEDNAGVWDDGDVSGRVLAWREGLLAGDEAVVAEVYGYPRSWGPDHQQLRAAVRACQQALEEEASATSGPAATTISSSSAAAEGQGEEDLTAVLAEAAARSRRGSSSSSGGAAAPPKSRALLKSLTKMLKPLAMRVVAEADAKGASGEDSDEEEEVEA